MLSHQYNLLKLPFGMLQFANILVKSQQLSLNIQTSGAHQTVSINAFNPKLHNLPSQIHGIRKHVDTLVFNLKFNQRTLITGMLISACTNVSSL